MENLTKISNAINPKDGLSPIGLNLPENMTYEEWEKVGFQLKHIVEGFQWWVGDWLNYGERNYGENYSQGMTVTGLKYKTLANIKTVCSKVKLSLRSESLSYTHHGIVAPLEQDKQKEWLDKAVNEKMTVKQLKEAVKSETLKDNNKQNDPTDKGIKVIRTINKNINDYCYFMAALTPDNNNGKPTSAKLVQLKNWNKVVEQMINSIFDPDDFQNYESASLFVDLARQSFFKDK